MSKTDAVDGGSAMNREGKVIEQYSVIGCK